MTPIGHLSVSYIAGKIIKKVSIPAILIGGVLPDIDFLLIGFPFFNQIHRIVSHNIFFVLIVACLGCLFKKKPFAKEIFWGLFIGGLLHLLVDACIDSNPSNGIGIRVLWPLLPHYYFSPINLAVTNNHVTWQEPIKMLILSLQFIIWEIPIYVIALILMYRQNKNQHHQN